MPKFRYTAMDARGTETQGIVDAANQSQALAAIRSKNYFPTKVVEMDRENARVTASVKGKKADAGLHREIKLPDFLKGRIKAKSLTAFTRQLATLQDAGLPLLRGLRILLKQEKNPALREALSGMGEAVEGGSTFSEALGQYPKIFDHLFVNMVKAGEAGGVLVVVLQRLAEFMEKAQRIRNKIKSAMIYPIVVLVFAIGILVFLMIMVIPNFKEIFEDLLEGEPLPVLTQFVINVSTGFVDHWYYIAGGLALLIVVAQTMRASRKGRHILDSVKLRAPIFGPLFSKTAIARFTRTLGTLMSSGVPVLQALNIVRDTAGNVVVADAVQQVHDSVKEGETMAVPMDVSGVFPNMVVSMVDVGEETGALPEMLIKVADNYEDEVDNAVEGLTSIIEPVMIVALALIVGTIVIAMFVPLIDIIGKMT
jgi:type IV pilus assembly protein PilC